MGWHYILTFKCKILPEFIKFIEKRYLDSQFDEENDPEYMYRPRWMDSYELTEEEERLKEEYKKEKDEEREKRQNEYDLLPKSYRDLIDIWNNLAIGSHFYEYNLDGDEFLCKISKKVNWHSGLLQNDYEKFLKDIIVPITSEIIECEIESDDYGDTKWHYSDSELRNVSFRLEDKVKSIEHTYNEDMSEILETRVIYKHSIKKKYFLDLQRAYGFKE
jgi:hypothetical protein